MKHKVGLTLTLEGSQVMTSARVAGAAKLATGSANELQLAVTRCTLLASSGGPTPCPCQQVMYEQAVRGEQPGKRAAGRANSMPCSEPLHSNCCLHPVQEASLLLLCSFALPS